MQVNPVISAETASDMRQDIFKIGASLCVFMPLCSILATAFLFMYSYITGVPDENLADSFLKSDFYPVYSIVVSIIPILVSIIILLIGFNRKFIVASLRPTVSFRKFLCITALGMSAIVLGSNVAGITNALMEIFNLKTSEVAAPEGAYHTVVFLLVYIVLAPVTEEILFRSIILERLRRYGDIFAVLSSAMMFSLLHASLQSFPSAFISGCVFALISIYSGSSLASMIVHATNNAISVISIIIAHSASDEIANVFLTVSIYLLAAFSLVAFFKLKNKSRETFFLHFSGEVLSKKRKAGILLLSFPMIIFILMTVSTAISAAI